MWQRCRLLATEDGNDVMHARNHPFHDSENIGRHRVEQVQPFQRVRVDADLHAVSGAGDGAVSNAWLGFEHDKDQRQRADTGTCSRSTDWARTA
eukprot:CAMPEP_0179213086 /NCGR_PEP_ID=MMETSP0797-20121207/1484_1 /TAXON_ID=47934 /ORGANISM="Dinophysis acuminata, Strain DAEP01" /LENGTH=93 /DNA_ID=CAMNT_0020918807 /DNA_START=150 /DNA_END=431 /DNA_ORIENTATION=+